MFTQEALVNLSNDSGAFSEIKRDASNSDSPNYLGANLRIGFCQVYGIGITKNIIDGFDRIVEVYFARNAYSFLFSLADVDRVIETLNVSEVDSNSIFQHYDTLQEKSFRTNFILALCYENSIGVARSPQKAFELYKLVAGQGYWAAQYRLGCCYEYGIGVEKNRQEAGRFYLLALGQCADAQDVLAHYYFKEEVCAKIALHLAAEKGFEAVEAELKKGNVNINAQDEEGRTALHIAAESGDVKAIAALLKTAGINVDKRDKEGWTPLCFAVASQCCQAVLTLADAGADPGPVLTLAEVGVDTSAALILREGSNVKAKILFELAKTEKNKKIFDLLVLKKAMRMLEINAVTSKPQASLEGNESEKSINKLQDKKFRKNSLRKETSSEKKDKVETEKQQESLKEATLISAETLFSKKLEEKIILVNSMKTKMDKLSDKKRKLQETILLSVYTSAQLLEKPFTSKRQEKSRLPRLELNLRDLKHIKKIFENIKKQEEVISRFAERYTKLQKNLENVERFDPSTKLLLTEQENKDTSEDTFAWNNFLQTLVSTAGKTNDVKNAVLQEGLEESVNYVIRANDIFYSLMSELEGFSVLLKTREEDCLELRNRFAFLLDTNDKTTKIYNEIQNALTELGLSKEKTPKEKEAAEKQGALEAVASEEVFLSQQESTRNDRSGAERRIIPNATEQTVPLEDTEPKMEQTVKKNRLAAFNKEQERKKLAWLQGLQNCRVENRIAAIVSAAAKGEVFPRPSIRQEEKTTVERSLLLTQELVDLHREVEKLKSIIAIISEKNEWTQEREYAILQGFAFVNEVAKDPEKGHPDDSIKSVACKLRNAIYKDHRRVMDTLKTNENLLVMVTAWVRFLETTKVIGFFADDEGVLKNVRSDLLREVYGVGLNLPNDCDAEKCTTLVSEMMAFRSIQKYESHSNVYLISCAADSSQFLNFIKLIENKSEIMIASERDGAVIYFKDKSTCKMASFKCNENLQTDISTLVQGKVLNFNNKILSKSTINHEEFYGQVYASVRLQNGCAFWGEDIIGEQANKFCLAILSSASKALKNAARTEDHIASQFLSQPDVKAYLIHLEELLFRGRTARHGQSSTLEGTKYNNGGAKLLFQGLRTRICNTKEIKDRPRINSDFRKNPVS